MRLRRAPYWVADTTPNWLRLDGINLTLTNWQRIVRASFGLEMGKWDYHLGPRVTIDRDAVAHHRQPARLLMKRKQSSGGFDSLTAVRGVKEA